MARAVMDRVALARAVLAWAEERTGTEGWSRPAPSLPPGSSGSPVSSGSAVPAALVASVATFPGAPPVRSSGSSSPAPPGTPGPATSGLATSGPATSDPATSGPAAPSREAWPPGGGLPVQSGLEQLLPGGALTRGSTVVVSGSTSLALALLARASREGSWVALVGLPEIGVLAAHQAGFDLERVVLVPDPGPDGPRAVAALLDGVDVVVVGSRVALGHGDRRRLSARARERSAVLLSTGPWPGARTVLTAGASRWEGLGRGHGRLRSRRLTVHRSGRGSAARERTIEVHLHERPGTGGDTGLDVGGGTGPGIGGDAGPGVGFGTPSVPTRAAG